MKKAVIKITLISVCIASIILLTSFNFILTSTLTPDGKKATAPQKDPVTFFAHNPILLSDGTTYTGTVTASGAINQSGTNIMYTQTHGTALHCIIVMSFPDGTLTIRMNCNMKTSNGRWKILDGTEAYADTQGEGSLVMPNDVDEILTGFIQ